MSRLFFAGWSKHPPRPDVKCRMKPAGFHVVAAQYLAGPQMRDFARIPRHHTPSNRAAGGRGVGAEPVYLIELPAMQAPFVRAAR